MAIAKNAAKDERGIRIILAVILIVLGFYLSGYWGPISIVAGCFFLVTAFVGY